MNDLPLLAEVLGTRVLVVEIKRGAQDALAACAAVTRCAVIGAIVIWRAILKGFMHAGRGPCVADAEIIGAGLVILTGLSDADTNKLSRGTLRAFAEGADV